MPNELSIIFQKVAYVYYAQKNPPLICEGGKKKGKKEKLYQTVKQLINLSGVIPAAVGKREAAADT